MDRELQEESWAYLESNRHAWEEEEDDDLDLEDDDLDEDDLSINEKALLDDMED